MDIDEDSFASSRASLQSRRERLAKRSEQNALEAQRSGLVEPSADTVVSSLLNGLPAASTDVSDQVSRTRRHSDTRSATNDGTSGSRADGSGRVCRDREYVQPKIEDQCDDVALSLIQSSSILSMEEQGNHFRGRILSGEGNMASLRRTMPARMRSSTAGERNLLDTSTTAAESPTSPMVRRTSVDCYAKVPNGESSADTPPLRRQSSFSNESTSTEAKAQLGWMPGNSVLTSRPVLASVITEDRASARERLPPERTPSDESREERIARYKEQRRRSKVLCNGSEERETSGPVDSDIVHKRWHSLDDQEQQQQQQAGLRRGSSVFFDARRQTTDESAHLPLATSSASEQSSAATGCKRDLTVSKSEEPLALRPTALKLEHPPAGANLSDVTGAALLLPTSSGTSVGDGQQLKLAATPEGKNPDLPGSTNARRNSRRRRSNMHLDAEQPEVTPTLHEVPAEAEAADTSLASNGVVTRPRRRRPTDKSDTADTGTRDILDNDSGQALSKQWQHLTAPVPVAAAAARVKEAATPERCNNAAIPDVDQNGKQKATVVLPSDGSLEKQLTGAVIHADGTEPCNLPKQPSDVLGVPAAGASGTASDPEHATVTAHDTEAGNLAGWHLPNGIPHEESKSSSDQIASGLPWKADKTACHAAPATVPAVETSNNARKLRADLEQEAIPEKTMPSLPAASEVTSAEAKDSTSCTLDTVQGADGAGVRAVITQNKSRSEKKAAALGLILQKFEVAGSGLPPAIAAAIGLPTPTSATSPPPKKVAAAKSGKVENVIKQMASHQLEPTTGAHQPEKTQAHPSASVESLVRKFAGTGSPPASLHVSLLSSTDGACSDTTATASKSASPVRPASPASLVDVSAARDAPQRPGSDRAPSPKTTGFGHPAASTLSSHSSPGSQRKSPVIVSRSMSPNGMQTPSGADAFRATDSDASSQLTDDGQHSDTASGYRAAAPVIKPLLQSPTKLQNLQQPYFSATGKKSSKTGSSPVTPVVGSAQIATECSTENGTGQFEQLQRGKHDERHIGDPCLKKEMVVGEAAVTVTPTAELPAGRFSPSMQADVGDRPRQECRDAGAGTEVTARRSAPSDGFADPTAAAVTTAPDSSAIPVSAEHDRVQPISPDGHVKDTQQPQPFAKLRAAPAATKTAVKSEQQQQQQLDPQLANILQARLKKVETKPTARLSSATTVHDDHKPVSKEETVDRATHSIKDKALYFMQMQQKLQSGGDAAPVPPSRVLAPTGHVSQLPASARTVGSASAGNDGRTGQGKERQSGSAVPVVAASSPPEQAPAQPRKERRRMRSRRRGSLSGDERDRWQTQPVTDSEVLVAAAVVVRGQTMTGSSDCPQPEGTGVLVTSAAAQPGNTTGMDEVRRLAVMTLEEKIGLFMDRSVAWTCYDADAAPTSPDRSIRHLPIDHRAAATHCRRAAWRGRFSTQPVSQKELRSALSMLGSSGLAPPVALDATFNQKIAQLCKETEMRRQAAIQTTEVAGSKQKHGNDRASTRRSSGNKKSSEKAVVSSPHGSRENQHHDSTTREAGSNATDKRGQRTSRFSAGSAQQRPNSMHAESPASVDTPSHNGNEMSRNASLRQSGCAPKMRSKVTDKPTKQRPVSMNGEVNVHHVNKSGHLTSSPVAPSHDSNNSVHNASPVVRLRPHSAKASLGTQNKARSSGETKTAVVATGHGDKATTRPLSIQDSEGKIAVSPGTTTGHKGHHASNAGLTKDRDTHVREQETAVTEPLTRADKSKSQPCISTISDSSPADELPSYMRATTSYARKVEHLLAESDEDDDDDRVADDDRSSLDGSRRETNLISPFQRAGTELNANRASVRRTLGPRASTGGQLESPVSPHNGGDSSYTRATKATSMRDIRTPGNKTPQHANDQAAIGTKTKLRSMDGSRNSLPARPSSAVQLHGSAMDRSSSDDDDLPSYMRATKSFARKVEHLIESCDEEENENDETTAAARLDECSDEGELGSSARSPTARRSRTPSTHGGSDLTPSDLVMQEGRSIESEGARERQPAHKVASKRATPSKSGSAASLNQEGSGHPASSQSSMPVLQQKSHGGGKNGSPASQMPVVDGKRHKATAATMASMRDTMHADTENTHGTKVDADHGKAQRRSKDKHALIGGDLPSFMRATKSSLTKDRHLVDAAAQEQNSPDDQDKTAKISQQPTRKPQPQHHKGQGSRESLSSVGAASSKADSGHLSSGESADHAGHTASIPLISLPDSHMTVKQGKLPSRISNNGGMLARHSKQQIGAVEGSAG